MLPNNPVNRSKRFPCGMSVGMPFYDHHIEVLAPFTTASFFDTSQRIQIVDMRRIAATVLPLPQPTTCC
jgi:hypothetical protein